ncbi:MAG: DUF4145 domain-containing protein [Pseudomonadaceae bacterium]|nr:DUF4145 domain-containing protein [Pseudomonadaceae bacterium]
MGEFDPRKALELARNLQKAAPRTFVPPSEATRPKNEYVVPHSLVSGTRGYIEHVVYQINGCYENGWFDACAVMMRRLLETLIIECYEAHNIDHQVKNKDGDFLMLGGLIDDMLQNANWNLGRTAKKSLRKLKEIGDKSAHSRRYNAHRPDIDRLQGDFRDVCQELLYLSKLK